MVVEGRRTNNDTKRNSGLYIFQSSDFQYKINTRRLKCVVAACPNCFKLLTFLTTSR